MTLAEFGRKVQAERRCCHKMAGFNSQGVAYEIPVSQSETKEYESKQKSVLPEHLRTRLETYRGRKKSLSEEQLQAKLEAAERRRQSMFMKKVQAERRCCQKMAGFSRQGVAYEIPVSQSKSKEDEPKQKSVLPEHLKVRLETYRGRKKSLSEEQLQAKLEAAERRRQTIYQYRADSARAAQERCQRLAEAVQVMVAQDTARKAIERGEQIEKPYSNYEVRDMLKRIETDIEQVLGRLENEARRLGSPLPRPMSPSFHMKRPTAFEIPAAELKLNEKGELPSSLRERLSSYKAKSKISKKYLQEKLENAERRRTRIHQRKAESARLYEVRWRRVAQANAE